MAVTARLIAAALWPFRAAVSLATLVVSGILALILLPFKIVASIFKTGKQKAQAAVAWTEGRIIVLRQRKPFVYVFPPPPTAKQQEVDVPDGAIVSPQKSESINSIIQDLERLGNYESPVLSRKEKDGATITQLTQQIKSIDKASEEEKCQLLKLIHELQELATSESPSTQHMSNEDDEVSELLADLNVLETYLTDFLREQQDPLKQSLMASSLETIMEEDTSHEASPSYPGSPLPRSNLSCEALLRKRRHSSSSSVSSSEGVEPHGAGDGSRGDGGRSQGDGGRSQGDGGRSHGNDGGGGEANMESLISSLEQQQKFMQTQLDLQNVMDSLNMHTSLSTTPKSSPATPIAQPTPTTPTDTDQIYDSLTPVYSIPLKKKKDVSSATKPATTVASITEDKTIIQDPIVETRPSTLPIQDDIYDRIPAAETHPASTESPPVSTDTPPPVPVRRNSLDGGIQRVGSDGASSNEYSPMNNRRSKNYNTCTCKRCQDDRYHDDEQRYYHDDERPHYHDDERHCRDNRRRYSESDECSCKYCCDDHHSHRRRHSHDGEHRRKHRKHSSRHHCRNRDHSDHSPDCCGHRNRSRERKSSHHHRHRSSSDESRDDHRDYDNQRRVPESSGYESQENADRSPKYPRKGSLSESEPSTPRESRRGLFGLFSKRTGSTTSLTSTKSEL